MGYGSYALQRYLVRKAAREQLAVVSGLKVGQIKAWIDHEKSTALGLVRGMLVSHEVEGWLSGGTLDAAEQTRLLDSLKTIQGIFGYRDVGLLSAGAEPLLSSSGLQEGVDRYDKWVLVNALLTGQPQLGSVRWDEKSIPGSVHLDVFTPMVARVQGRDRVVRDRVIGILRLRLDPTRDLFPLVQDWPVPTETAEALITETQGADVIFLNEMRQRKGMALRLKFPMSDPELLAAQVARGAVDVPLEGKDYLGHRVLGMGRAVPETQWHVIAKQDQAEIYQELWPRTLLTGLAALGFMAIASLSFLFWLRQRLARQVGAELEGLVRARTLQLQGALEKAQAADHAKMLFLARIGHELFTPLNHMQLYAQLLREEWPGPGEPESVERILASGRSLESLLRQILRYADLEAGREKALPAPFSPGALAGQLAERFRPRAVEKGLDFVCETGRDLPGTWVADAGIVEDLLEELLGNAIKFTVRGRVVLRVSAGPGLRFEVEDTGPGIPAASLEQVFQPLEQADGTLTRSHGGAGLGLAVARHLARVLGGQLVLEAPEGGGCRFRLELPEG